MLKKIRNIRTIIIMITIPVFLLSIVLVGFIGYNTSTKIMQKNINHIMKDLLHNSSLQVESELKKHAQISIDLARIVKAGKDVFQEQQYINMLTMLPKTNDATVGAGIWFEPYKYKANLQYFRPFAYKDGDEVIYTDEWALPEYNYPGQEWYLNGMNTDKLIAWSTPYYDDIAKITMVTATAPFYDKNNEFCGVATADIDIKKLQDMIKEIKVGEYSNAYLLTADGTYIAGTDVTEEQVTKEKISSDERYSDYATEILSGTQGKVTFTSYMGKNQMYYTTIPETNWIVAISFLEKDIFADITSMKNIQIAIGLVAIMICYM